MKTQKWYRFVLVFLSFMVLAPKLSFCFGQNQPIYTERIAFSHDGNRADCDDIGAVAWNFAVLWSFGMADKLVHLDYANNFNPSEATQCSNQYTESQKSVNEAVTNFPGFDKSKIFDCQKNVTGAIANFKAEAEKSTATNRLTLIIAGPCEVPWRMINAVAADKRQFIQCISHSAWNEGYYSTNNMTHKWSDMKSNFPTVKYIDIIDQNDYVGKRYSGISTAWDFLSTLPAVCGVTNANFKWLLSRDMKSGDVSDVGMLWYLLTGDQKGTPPDYKVQFSNPVCSSTPSPLAISTASLADATIDNVYT